MPRTDPYKNNRFLLEIGGIKSGTFSECSGFGSEMTVVEYREGGEPSYTRKLPGQAKYPDITLKWGITDSTELYDWHKKAIDGNIERKNGSILLLDDTGTEKRRWNFFEAWPSKYTAPTFNAKGADVAIESLTLVCERLERG